MFYILSAVYSFYIKREKALKKGGLELFCHGYSLLIFNGFDR